MYSVVAYRNTYLSAGCMEVVVIILHIHSNVALVRLIVYMQVYCICIHFHNRYVFLVVRPFGFYYYKNLLFYLNTYRITKYIVRLNKRDYDQVFFSQVRTYGLPKLPLAKMKLLVYCCAFSMQTQICILECSENKNLDLENACRKNEIF